MRNQRVKCETFRILNMNFGVICHSARTPPPTPAINRSLILSNLLTFCGLRFAHPDVGTDELMYTLRT